MSRLPHEHLDPRSIALLLAFTPSSGNFLCTEGLALWVFTRRWS